MRSAVKLFFPLLLQRLAPNLLHAGLPGSGGGVGSPGRPPDRRSFAGLPHRWTCAGPGYDRAVERSSDTRESARLEMPEPMRRDVRLLGEILGQVIVESGSEDLLADVERLRRAVIAARDSAEHDREAVRLVSAWPLARAEEVARAFTCYFHLANLAEEQQRARTLRERDRGATPLSDSLAAAVRAIREDQGDERLQALLSGLQLHPVLTAHPTEARRRAVVTAIRRIGEQLERLDDPLVGDSERAEGMRRLDEEFDEPWRT